MSIEYRQQDGATASDSESQPLPLLFLSGFLICNRCQILRHLTLHILLWAKKKRIQELKIDSGVNHGLEI